MNAPIWPPRRAAQTTPVHQERIARILATVLAWRSVAPWWCSVLGGVLLALLGGGARLAIFGSGTKVAYITFWPMVGLAAAIGQPLMGATVIVVSALLIHFIFVPLAGAADNIALMIYVLTAGFIVAVTETLFRTRALAIAEHQRAGDFQRFNAAIVESSNDAIITKTLDGIVRSWNPAATRLLGYQANEIIGRPIRILFPQGKEAEESEILGRVRRGEAVEHYQTTRRAKDGRILNVSVTISPIRDSRGAIIGASKILRDFTQLKQAFDALHASEERLRFALEGARAAAWQWDCVTEVSTWSDRFIDMHGLDAGRVSPSFSRWLESVLPEDRAMAEAAALEALKPGAPDYHMEYRVRANDGGVRWIEIFGLVERNAEDKPLRMSGITMDVTGRHEAWEAVKRSNAELAHANESLKRFSYIAAHDLQEPLRKIQQFGDLLITEFGDSFGGDATFYMTVMRDSSERMRQLIRDLLAFSRAANRALSETRVDLNQVAERAVSQCAVAIEEARAVVVVSALPEVVGDERLIEQLLVNLIANAVKYGRDGVEPRVAIAARETEEAWLVSVSDNGVGIAEADQEKIFEAFARLHSPAKVNGAGLGLAICRTVCERHGWRIALSSELGEGSTFTIIAPKPKS